MKDENAKLNAKAAASFRSKQTNTANANAVTDPFTNIQDSLDKRFKLLQESLTAIINEKMKKEDNNENTPKTYAKAIDAHASNYADTVRKDKQVHIFCEIVTAAKKEELAEERERNSRRCNIIIHGCEEGNGDDQSAKDKVFLNKLITDLAIGKVYIKSSIRIGQMSEGKNALLK